jgi:hypothetical protein
VVELSDERIDSLISLIRDSFRVRPNQDPIYVDVAGNLERVVGRQHQVVFGRRGSGKSCLLVHFHRQVAAPAGILSVYIDSDEIKRLGYPDVLIRLLLSLTMQMPGPRRNRLKRRLRFKPTPLEAQAAELRSLLDLAEDADVTEGRKDADERKAELGVGHGPANFKYGRTTGSSADRTSSFKERKLDTLERHFQDYKRTLHDAFVASGKKSGAVIVDDFYLFHRSTQPDIVDYLHRLLRGTDMYLKLGTVRHRTTLLRHEGQTIGVELSQDVEEINLDRTFEDVAATAQFLRTMLDSLCKQVAIDSAAEFISDDGLLALTLASGGVPRDYLNILVDGIDAARSLRLSRVTPKGVYRGAGRNSYRTKLTNLRDDAARDAPAIEQIFQDLAAFCLREEKKTAFLINQGDVIQHEAEHEVIQQLMDFKLIHVIEPDTSAASGRSGRFEAYTLDFALFMEPRLRGIAHVEFWKTDAQRRRAGVREAPAYPLERARDVLSAPAIEGGSTEGLLESIEQEVGSVEAAAEGEAAS